jgi:hypothetical protein
LVVDLGAFASDDSSNHCWKYNLFVLRDELPDNEKNAIVFDNEARIATIFSE